MSERKVLNKYFPPNFDPSLIPRQKKPKDLQHKVRLMSPFSMRCESCGEYIYKGKKFNARKETVEGEMYLNIKIYRFYIRCPRCSAEITFKTDPKNTDYVSEKGASRNFEPWRGEEEPSGGESDPDDPMKSLEDRTLDSKREMDIMDALDEIRTRNARSERLDVDDVLERFNAEDKAEISSRMKEEEEEDEKQAKAIFESADGEQVRKLKEAEPDALELVNQNAAKAMEIPSFKPSAIIKKRKLEKAASPVVIVKKKKNEEPAPAPKKNALSLLAGYDDDDDSSSSD